MDSDRYDICRIKARPDQILVKGEPDEDLYNEVLKSIDSKDYYNNRRQKLDYTYNEILQKITKPILDDLQDVVKRVFVDGAFPDNEPRVHAAVLILDMQMSDQNATFVMIEEHLKKHGAINVQRINYNNRRKRNILELIDAASESNSTFLMIEQAETLDTCLVETIVGDLLKRLKDPKSKTTKAMVLFCLSVKLQNMAYDSMVCFGKMETIKKHLDLDRLLVMETLVRNPGITMKFDPVLLNVIYDIFLNLDASITNLKFIVDLTFKQYCQMLSELDPSNPLFDVKSKLSQRVLKNHEHLCDQLLCYYELLQSKEKWPVDLTDLYEELLIHDDLARSAEFYGAVKGLNLKPEALLNRFKRTKKKASNFSVKPDGLMKLILKYESIFENNDDCEELVTKFINEVCEHAKSLKNPSYPCQDAYYKDCAKVASRILDTVESEEPFEAQYLPQSAYYDTVCRRLLDYGSQMTADALWTECSDKLGEIAQMERMKKDTKAFHKVTKSTPKKKPRLTHDIQKTINPKEEKDISGLSKSMFLDLLITLEHEHMIKLVRKGSKGLLIKRLKWLH